MGKILKKKGYGWKYCSLGGVTRVILSSGEDIAHLRELDQKKWTVLSCPVDGLEFDPETLAALDADGDGKIKVREVVDAAEWVTSAIRDKDLLLKGKDSMELDAFDDRTPVGQLLKESAAHILRNLGKDKTAIALEDTADSAAIFAGTALNGDGVITVATAAGSGLGEMIPKIVGAVGGKQDRSGEEGVDAEKIEAFYEACTGYSEWMGEAEARRKEIFPFGEATAEAVELCGRLGAKIDDYFMRCRLIGFDEACSGAVDVSAEKIAAISDKNLSECAEQIAEYPLARPSADGLLNLDAINPAWRELFAKFRKIAIEPLYKGAAALSEDQWNELNGSLAPYRTWKSEARGLEVEPLGIKEVNAILAAGKKQTLLDLAAKDLELKEQSEAIDDVRRFLLLYRDLYAFLRNYVTFFDLYDPTPGVRSMFEAGDLYIDQRCCSLCVKLNGLGSQDNMASLSGMFLIYCTCTAKNRGETMDIVAAMTEGNPRNLRTGKNAIFYDRKGEVWDAVVTRIVENPISIRQAFWSPYRKIGEFISNLVNKAASEKENKVLETAQEKVTTISVNPETSKSVKSTFDIAKFAGIFAALGMAIGYIGGFLTTLGKAVNAAPLWVTLLWIAIIMLVVSAPSCVLAWMKLRKRNFGPVLNANGWAVNAVVLVNVPFGQTLTSVVKYPVVKSPDPYSTRVPLWKKMLSTFLLLLVAAFVVLYFTENLGFLGIERHPEILEKVVEEMTAPLDSTASQ